MDTEKSGQRKRADNVKAACVLLDALRAKMMDRQPFPAATKKAGILFTLNLIFRCYLRVSFAYVLGCW